MIKTLIRPAVVLLALFTLVTGLFYPLAVTGLAQVQGRGNLSFHETNEWDVEYVRNRSVWLDLKILWKTLWVSLRGDGAF